MSGDMTTQLDRPYAQQAETRAAAARRVSREHDADTLLDMLGLVDDTGPLVTDSRQARGET